jgi:thioredoxin-dependent peroxiredoxin
MSETSGMGDTDSDGDKKYPTKESREIVRRAAPPPARQGDRMKKLIKFVLSAGCLFGCAAAQRSDGGTGLLPAGSPAPDVSGVDQDGRTHRLKETVGSVTVVYFYPKDETPGCTKEACSFRDVWDKYTAAGVKLFAVSRDTSESHKGFAGKHKLPFPLIADPDGAWAKAFGVATRLGMYQRVSFVVGKDGKIAKVYDNVNPGVHAVDLLADIAKLEE